MKKITRRDFLEASAGVATTAALLPSVNAVGQGGQHESTTAGAWPENGTLIPDEGWRLWVDREAQWKQDEIFLP